MNEQIVFTDDSNKLQITSKRKKIKWSMFIFCAVLLYGIFFVRFVPSINGIIVDKNTKKPISGISVQYIIVSQGFNFSDFFSNFNPAGDTTSVYSYSYTILESTTGSDGSFSMPGKLMFLTPLGGRLVKPNGLFVNTKINLGYMRSNYVPIDAINKSYFAAFAYPMADFSAGAVHIYDKKGEDKTFVTRISSNELENKSGNIKIELTPTN